MAVSPPPTTMTCRSLKKNPSHVAQADTPRPISSFSPGTPSHLAEAPVAMMRVWAWYVSPSASTVKGRRRSSRRRPPPGAPLARKAVVRDKPADVDQVEQHRDHLHERHVHPRSL